MKVQVPPFRVPQSDSVVQNAWVLNTMDGAVPLLPMLKTWDYQTQLHLSSRVFIDRAAVLRVSDLADTSELALLVISRSSTTKIERPMQMLMVPGRDDVEIRLDFTLNGDELGGKVTLETLLVARSPVPLNRLAASRPGSILWRSTQTTVVDGLDAQFPTDAENFGATLPGARDAGWVLRVDQYDMDALFMSAVRLTLNSGLPAIQRMLQGSSDPSTVLLGRMLDLDITRQLVYLAIRSEEVRGQDVDHESLTLAGVLRSLLAQIWPTVGPDTLLRWANEKPDRIEGQLQNVRRLASDR